MGVTQPQMQMTMQGVVRIPGLPVLPPGVRRYTVAGGGSLTLSVRAGETLTLVDRQGRQACELVIFSAAGVAEPALLTALEGAAVAQIAPASALPALLADQRPSAQRLRKKLQDLGIEVRDPKALFFSGQQSRAGDTCAFCVRQDGLAIIMAPASPMAVDQHNPPSEIDVFIEGEVPAESPILAPPDPLAEPLQDLHIDAGTAVAYEVKAGEFIQILDVQGRQCSDFQAFDLRALEKGIERDIDPTTTRSLMGAIYPAPGLYSKYYTLDHQPLLETVRDTVGRHDTFGLACTQRYYDDMGYPGHVNCSDNMNRAAAPFDIQPRTGWPAINFFFNTNLDATNAITMDDPWSRPGDYVLMRALSDMVCVSTSCPCDIDPANGWNPTDIQVRVYNAEQDFSKGTAFRMTTQAAPAMTKETGFHTSFAAHTQDFAEYNGYWLANHFTHHGAIAEYWACREKAVVMDLSPLRKYEVTGPDAETLLQLCLTRNIRKLSTGQVVYTAMCYEHGGMIDDGTVFRLGENNFRWIGGTDVSGLWLREQAQQRGMDVWVKCSTDQLHNIAVQGPASRDILKQIVWTPPTQADIEELEWFRFAIGRIGDFHGLPIVVSRTGYTGELGYEIFCHPNDAPALFDAVWAAGQPHGLMPFGLEALDMVRIEAGLIFANYEFNDQTDPFEAGIGFTVPLKSKNEDFIGRDALVRRKDNPQRKLVGLDIAGNQVPGNGDCVRIGRAQVGEITSAMRSQFLKKTIALCRMDIAHAELGTNVEVGQLDGEQKRIPATVTAFPHFDPKKERVRV